MKINTSSCAMFVSLFLTSISLAGAQSGNQVISRNPNLPVAPIPAGQNQPGALKPARQFVGQDLKNQQGQKLGKIEDFVVDLESGKILYVVVNAGGGSRAIPGTLVQVAPDGRSFTTQATLQQVNSAPVVPKANTPAGGNLSFATSVYKHFNQPAWWDATSQSGQAFANVHRANQLTNYKVQDSSGQSVGTVQTPLLDLNAGRVAFLILNAGTVPGQPNQVIAVPPNAFTKGAGNFLVTGLDKNTIAGAPHVANWAELSNTATASSIYSYFGKQYYSADAGSVGAITTPNTAIQNPAINAQPNNQVISQNTGIQNTGNLQNQLGSLVPAQQFIGHDFKTQQGQKVGSVQDFIVDLESGRILYAIVNLAGASRAIPATLLQASAPNSITAQATQQQLNSAAVAQQNNPQQIGDIGFATSVYQTFNQPMWWGGTSQAGQSFGNVQRATQLNNFQVQDSSAQNVGTIQNVLLDVNAGRVAFLILNASTLLGQANQMIPVPPNAFTKGTGNFLVTGLDRNTLAGAPRATTNWAELSDPTKAASIYIYFGKQPYFGNSGLAPTGRPQ